MEPRGEGERPVIDLGGRRPDCHGLAASVCHGERLAVVSAGPGATVVRAKTEAPALGGSGAPSLDHSIPEHAPLANCEATLRAGVRWGRSLIWGIGPKRRPRTGAKA